MSTSAILPYTRLSTIRLPSEQEARMSEAYHRLRSLLTERGREVGEGQLYNSAYRGLTFTVDESPIHIHEWLGGLEDHTPGGLSVRVARNPETRWVMRHVSRAPGDVIPTTAEWDEGYAHLPDTITSLLAQASFYASTQVCEGESVSVREVTERFPDYTRGGLYVHLHGHLDDLVGAVGLDTAQRLAQEAGWNRAGATTFDLPVVTVDGLYARAYWFHDRVGATRSGGEAPAAGPRTTGPGDGV